MNVRWSAKINNDYLLDSKYKINFFFYIIVLYKKEEPRVNVDRKTVTCQTRKDQLDLKNLAH